MLIISRTPLRVSFFGGGTDYPVYFNQYGGAVLGTSIDQYIHISIKTLKSSFFDHNYRIAYSKTELVQEIDEIEHPSIRHCLKYCPINHNLEVNIFSDLPARTGLGSSSSFTVGFLNALHALKGMRISKQKLAEKACYVEQTLIQENVGCQDQFHTAYGGFNVIEFKKAHVAVRPVIMSRAKKKLLQDHLLLFFTKMTRHASCVASEQVTKTKNAHNTATLLEMHDLVYRAEEVLTTLSETEMMYAFGRLLDKSWRLKKRLSSKISLPEIDNAYEKALKAGAFGGKLCGAGSGGFLAIVAPPEKHTAIKNMLSRLPAIPACFEEEGSTIIYMKE